MKKIMVIVMQVMLCLNLSASNIKTTPNNCDWTTTNFKDKLNFTDQVRTNLVTGFWIKKDSKQANSTLIQFHNSGRVDWIVDFKNSNTNKYSNWKLNVCGDTPFLVLKKAEDEIEKCFKLELTCDGIVLTNSKTKESIVLENKSEAEIATIKAVKSGLAGNWSNATYPFDISKNRRGNGTRRAMKAAYLKISFQQDGTYLKKYGSEKVHLIEKGNWEVSRDGKFVFMDNDGKISVAKIQHLDLDEMVLEWQLDHPQHTDFSTEVKSFAFIR